MHIPQLSDYREDLLPITAIHGSASTGSLWRRLATLSTARRAVFAPDLTGYGADNTPEPDTVSTLEERAWPIIAAIEQSGRPTHLVAHSFGGSVALEVVARIPHRITSLTLFEPVSPALLRGTDQAEDLRLLGDILGLSEIVQRTSGAVGMESFINFWHEADAWSRLSDTARAKLARLAPVVCQDFRETYSVEPHVLSAISYRGPVNLLVGEQTNAHAKRMSEILTRQFPQASLVTLAGMGHMGPLTHSEIVGNAILEIIERVESEAQSIRLAASRG